MRKRVDTSDPRDVAEYVAKRVVVAVKLQTKVQDAYTAELERIISKENNKRGFIERCDQCKRIVSHDRICDFCSRPDWLCIVCDPYNISGYGKCIDCKQIFCADHMSGYSGDHCYQCEHSDNGDDDEDDDDPE
jgi:hypothetical protein